MRKIQSKKIKPKNTKPLLITPSSHVEQSKPYLQYGLGVFSGVILALLYLVFAIWLISSLVFSNQEPPPAAALPAFIQEEPFAADTLALPDPDGYEEDTGAVDLMETYLGDDLHSADLNSDGLLIVNLQTGVDSVSLTEEQADTVHGSYLSESERKDYYAGWGASCIWFSTTRVPRLSMPSASNWRYRPPIPTEKRSRSMIWPRAISAGSFPAGSTGSISPWMNSPNWSASPGKRLGGISPSPW